MTKLSNGTEYNNSKLPVEFAEYLIQNGFQSIQIKDGICLFKPMHIKLFIKSDCMDMFLFKPELEYNQWQLHQSHSGISNLNFFDWIMMMHIMNVLSIKQFMKNVSKTSIQQVAEADFLIQNVIRHQLPHSTFSA